MKPRPSSPRTAVLKVAGVAAALVAGVLSPVASGAASADTAGSVIAVPRTTVSVGNDRLPMQTETPSPGDLARVEALAPLAAGAGSTTRYVAEAGDGYLAAVDIVKVAGAVRTVAYTAITPTSTTPDVHVFQVGAVDPDDGSIQVTRASSDGTTSQFNVAAAGVCSSNCNLVSTIGSTIVGIGCGALGIVGGVPSAGASAYAALVGCAAASGGAGYYISDNCQQSTFCTPRVVVDSFTCDNEPRFGGCRALGRVVSMPALRGGPNGQYFNNGFYEYIAPAVQYYRSGFNTIAGNITFTTEVTNSGGVYFYVMQHDISQHQFACPVGSTVLAQVTVEGGTSDKAKTSQALGC